MVWMETNLLEAGGKESAWLETAASTATELLLSQLSPASVPSTLLDMASKAISGQVGEVIPGGHGFFSQECLNLSRAEKASLEADQALFKAVGESTFLVVWAAAGSTAPIFAGIVLGTTGLKYFFKRDEIASKKLWEDITTSMMKKYEKILLQAAKKNLQKESLINAIEQIRIEEFKVEEQKGESVIAKARDSANNTVKLTSGALVRLFIYVNTYLNLKVDQGTVTKET